MKIAVYPGSFDPITLGHLNIIKRASRIFDKVIVCVAVNSAKRPKFSMEERADFVRRVIGKYGNVEAEAVRKRLREVRTSFRASPMASSVRLRASSA